MLAIRVSFLYTRQSPVTVRCCSVALRTCIGVDTSQASTLSGTILNNGRSLGQYTPANCANCSRCIVSIFFLGIPIQKRLFLCLGDDRRPTATPDFSWTKTITAHNALGRTPFLKCINMNGFGSSLRTAHLSGAAFSRRALPHTTTHPSCKDQEISYAGSP